MRTADYVEILLEGEDGKKVVDMLKKELQSVCVLKAALSKIKKAVMQSGDARSFHPKHSAIVKKMMRLARQTGDEAVLAKARAIKAGSLKYRFDAKRKAKARRTFFGHAELDQLLATMPVLPDNFSSFVLPKAIALKCKTIAEHNLAVKNESIRIIEDGAAMLKLCANYIKLAASDLEPSLSVPKLAVCLLLVSGRRTSEILNGKSSFSPGSTPMSVLFDGQLKKNRVGEEGADASFEIPVLLEADVFIKAFERLRALQGYAVLSNEQVNSKYAANLSFWTKKMFAVRSVTKNSIAEFVRPHDLRTIYVIAAYELFEFENQGLTINAFAKWALGHDGLQTTLNYASIKVKKLPAPFSSDMAPKAPKSGKRIKRPKLTRE